MLLKNSFSLLALFILFLLPYSFTQAGDIPPSDQDESSSESDDTATSSTSTESPRVTRRTRKPATKKPCPHCHKMQTNLNRHIKEQHNKRENTFKCLKCIFSTERKDALLSHQRQHTGEKPYPCDQCEERFANPAGKKDHILRKHSGTKHKCDICFKLFATSDALEAHEADPEQHNYPCTTCGKNFVTSARLKRHAETHNKSTAPSKPATRKKRKKSLTNKARGQVKQKKDSNSSSNNDEASNSSDDIIIACDLCDKNLAGFSNYDQHMADFHPDIQFDSDLDKGIQEETKTLSKEVPIPTSASTSPTPPTSPTSSTSTTPIPPDSAINSGIGCWPNQPNQAPILPPAFLPSMFQLFAHTIDSGTILNGFLQQPQPAPMFPLIDFPDPFGRDDPPGSQIPLPDLWTTPFPNLWDDFTEKANKNSEGL